MRTVKRVRSASESSTSYQAYGAHEPLAPGAGGPGLRPDGTESAELAELTELTDLAELTDFPEPSRGAEPEAYGIVRLGCPDCAQPIALLDGEERLPEHARCSSPWDPFRLTVCAGSGRDVDEAVAPEGALDYAERDLAALLTLPESLDWRRQPFSHPGDAGAQMGRTARRTRRS